MEKGYTMMHEHITIDLSGVKKDQDCRLDCFEETKEELRGLYQLGVRRILDVTNMGMGRNPEYVSRMEKATGIQILQATGFYKEPFLPDFVYSMSEKELAELVEKEVIEGIEASGIKAKVIGEFGTSKGIMTDMEKKGVSFHGSCSGTYRCCGHHSYHPGDPGSGTGTIFKKSRGKSGKNHHRPFRPFP